MHVVIKDYSTLGVRYRHLQALVYKQETRNEAQPSAVLNFEFLVCKRVLVKPDNARTKCVASVLIFSLSKPLKYIDAFQLPSLIKSLNFTKRKTKLYTKTPHAVAPFVLVGLP